MTENPTDFRDGAFACLNALRCVCAPGADFSQETPSEYFIRRDAALREIIASGGSALPPAAAGAMAVLAEFLLNHELGGFSYSVATWEPEATMTAAAREATRQEHVAQFEKDLADDARYQQFKAAILAPSADAGFEGRT